MTDYAFVAAGRLYVSTGGSSPRTVESAYAATVRDRAHDIHRRHSWKGEGAQGGFGAMAWGRAPGGPPPVNARITGVTRGFGSGSILYAIDIDTLTAVCASDLVSGGERRLLHGSKAHIRDLCARPGRPEVACAVMHQDGTASIALMTHEASDLHEITEGESLDLFPSWADDGTPRIAYQAAGLGRDAAGRLAGFGRFEIHVLDVERGDVETAAAAPDADLERPRIAADGSLFYLSRPHAEPRAPLFRMAKDLVLLPPRILYAVFQYLNFFSARYTGKPLTTAAGPKGKTGDVRKMLQWANLVESGGDGAENDATSAVPRSHRLLRGRGSTAEVVAEGVACYDLAADGSILYATGSAVFRLDPDGRRHQLCDARGVDSLLAL